MKYATDLVDNLQSDGLLVRVRRQTSGADLVAPSLTAATTPKIISKNEMVMFSLFIAGMCSIMRMYAEHLTCL